MAGSKVYLTEKLKGKLSRITQTPLTLVSAPMGYGKTTALKAFLAPGGQEQGSPGLLRREQGSPGVLWQELMGGGEQGFWEDFRAVFREENEKFYRFVMEHPMPGLPDERRGFLAAFREFCRDCGAPLVLVFDGLEEETYVQIQDFLHFFVSSLPEGFHLVLSGRLAAANDDFYRIYGLVNQICQEDFAYSMRDMEQYFKLNGVTLPAQSLQSLYEMCSGWSVLVHINLREYQEHNSFLSEHEMFSLMERIVFSRMPERVLEFLSVMAFTDSFTEDQAEYLWGQGDAAAVIADLEKDGMFLQFDRSTGSYRLAPVFAGYFSWRNSRLTSGESGQWLNRLAEWYLKNDENERARRLYYRIKNFDALMDAVERRRFIVLYGLDEQEFISYYTDCPAQIRARHPKAILTFARQMFAFGRHEMGKEVCGEFEEIMENSGEFDEETRTQLTGTYELLLCYAQYNDLSAMLPHIYEAKKLLDSRRAAIPWPDTGLNDSLSLLYMYHRQPGDLDKEVALFSEYNPLYSALIGGRLDGADLVLQAEALYVACRFQEAEIAVYKAQLAIHRDRQWHTWLCVVLLQIRIALARGNWHSIEHLLGEVADSVSLKKEYRIVPATDILDIFLYSKLGQPQKIRAQFDVDILARFTLCFRAAPMLYCVQAEALLAKGEHLRLLAMSDKYMEAARTYPNIYAELMLHILIAGTYEALSNGEKARFHLKMALQLAAPDHILMPFVELGRYIRQTLDELTAECASAKLQENREGQENRECQEIRELQEIQEQSRSYEQGIRRITSEHFAQPSMGLTARELEIAKLAAKRLSNKEIAAQLVISESTVKTQLARAFSKLEIQKRRDLNRFFPEK